MPATAQGNYLEITNFTASAAPVLYDITNNIRYTANTAVAGKYRFRLQPSGVDRNLVLVSEDASNIININSLAKKNFTDFSNTANQGDYLIISNKILFTGASDYAAYRSSAAGGSYRTKIYDIDELVDQFAYGIKKHPLSVKNFLRYARHHFASAPKFAFLIGKAVTYDDSRMHESSRFDELLNLVPTFGWPASDAILASEDLQPIAATPIGRLAVISNSEVETYLDKVKEYEQHQANTSQTIEDKAWMKNMIHVVGANDVSLYNSLNADLNAYKTIISDTLFGANVTTFNKNSCQLCRSRQCIDDSTTKQWYKPAELFWTFCCYHFRL